MIVPTSRDCHKDEGEMIGVKRSAVVGPGSERSAAAAVVTGLQRSGDKKIPTQKSLGR